MDPSVQRLVVPEHQRTAIVEHLFGRFWPIHIEPLIFYFADTLAPDYCGGVWSFYRLPATDEGPGFYMAPDYETDFQVVCTGNQWSGTLSADALGITSCLTVYSQLSFSREPALWPMMAQHYHWLRQFMLGHPEAQAILGATD